MQCLFNQWYEKNQPGPFLSIYGDMNNKTEYKNNSITNESVMFSIKEEEHYSKRGWKGGGY